MSLTVHEFDGIIRQFRINPNQMPAMFTSRLTPNYTSIHDFELTLCENSLTIPSYQTHLGHLALVISPKAFAVVNNNRPFIEPANPGLTPTGTTIRATVESAQHFTFQQNEYMKYQFIKTALLNLILKTIDDKCIQGLKHDITSYANMSSLELLIYIGTIIHF